jgi:hypothetical protein
MRSALLALLLSLAALGCGGSSSETPPPLEPDPTSGRYTGPRLPNAADDAAADAAAALGPDANADDAALLRPQRPATATWGSGRTPTNPAAAPKMTSPTALPSATPGAGPAH